MYFTIGLVGVTLFVTFSLLLSFKKTNLSKQHKLWGLLLGFFLFLLGISITPSQETVNSKQVPSNWSASQKKSVNPKIVDKLKTSLENGKTIEFLKTYYTQPELSQIYYYDTAEIGTIHSKVSGIAFRTNSSGSSLHIYVPVDGRKSNWNAIVNTHQNAYVIIVHGSEGTFSHKKVGTNVLVSGYLEGRGDLRSGSSWDLYDAKLED